MKKLYYFIHKTSCVLVKTLILSIICSKCKNKNEKIFKKEESELNSKHN